MSTILAQPFHDSIRAYLIQFVPLLDAMGSGADRRIALDAIDDPHVPYGPGSPHVVFSEITDPEERLLDGSYVDFTRPVWQFDVWARTPGDRANVARALRSALRAWRGLWAGHEIRPGGVFLEMDRATSDPAPDDSGERDYRQMIRAGIWKRARENRIPPSP